ncbi:MAG: protein kinase [Chloroflexaceae bacterium]|nr:protein kinase [Chloroflexaceae bacterium]
MVAQVLAYSVQLCDVLNYLHRQNPPILHRDIKPANIRLTPDGLIKLVDFGLLKQGTGPTTRRALTPNYAPLEQWGQGGQHTDARSDIYSLGATLYHLLTGQLPLPAVDRISQGGDTLPSPLTYNAQLPPNVVYAIVKALAIKPEDRYPDAEKMKHDLVSGTKALTEPYVGPTRVPGADAPTRVVPVPVSEPRTPTVKNHAGFCRQCGEPYQNDEIYCQKCGRPISIQSRVCSRCKGKNALNARFCTKCGNAL